MEQIARCSQKQQGRGRITANTPVYAQPCLTSFDSLCGQGNVIHISLPLTMPCPWALQPLQGHWAAPSTVPAMAGCSSLPKQPSPGPGLNSAFPSSKTRQGLVQAVRQRASMSMACAQQAPAVAPCTWITQPGSTELGFPQHCCLSCNQHTVFIAVSLVMSFY